MKIAILSNGNGNYSTKRLKEEAELRGHTVKIIKYKNCYVSIEQGKNQIYYKGKPLGKFDAIIPRIASHMTKYGTTIVRQLEMQGEYTLSRSLAITRARDKLRSMQLLAKNNIDIPKTVVSRNTADIDELLDQLGEMPVIIKLASGTHGNGVVLAESRKAAKSVMQAFYLNDDSGVNILLQEFVKESAGTDIRAFVVGNKVVASMQRQSLDDDFRSNLHKGGSGKPIKLYQAFLHRFVKINARAVIIGDRVKQRRLRRRELLDQPFDFLAAELKVALLGVGKHSVSLDSFK